jgi:hypothetical protein
MFAEIASQAAEYGLLVLIACHRTTPSAWPGQGKWYDGKITEARVLQSWTKLAGTLCGHWNVFAADIQNEPWSASWGMGRGSDWNVAASRIGNHVLGKCPRWLIFVEGVGHTPGAAGQQPNAGYWWGGNLVGVHTAPVKLKDQSRLVYSPHTYGPSVYLQDYFKVNNFPSNMAQIWNDHWAFVRQATGTPIVIGEIGGFYTQKDRVWQDWAVQFCGAQGIGLFYFALNPTSDDTGGLLRADWTTPEAQKLANLARLPASDVLSFMPKKGVVAAKPPPPPYIRSPSPPYDPSAPPPPHPSPPPPPPPHEPHIRSMTHPNPRPPRSPEPPGPPPPPPRSPGEVPPPAPPPLPPADHSLTGRAKTIYYATKARVKRDVEVHPEHIMYLPIILVACVCACVCNRRSRRAVTAAAQKAAEKAGEEGKKRRRRRKYKRKLDGDDDDGDDDGGGGDNGGGSDTADEAEDDAGGGERRATARESETELVSAVDRIFAPKVRCEL